MTNSKELQKQKLLQLLTSKHPQKARFVEQKNRELFEQKNTIPSRLNSYNFASGLDYDFLQPQNIRSRL